MGEHFLRLIREKWTFRGRLAFLSASITTLLIHMYKFVNTLPNHDSLFNYYSDQNVLGSGRWFLSAACSLSTYFDLPWILGLLCCVLIGLTALVVTELLDIRNPVLIVLSGGLLAAAPATTETFFFLFTADGYMLAMVLAALGAYFSRMEEERPSRHLLSCLCICLSCGIYQAYVSFALVLSLCHFLLILLEQKVEKQQSLRWILRQVLIYAGALAAYYGIWKLCLAFTGTPVNQYQGIGALAFHLGLIFGGILRALRSVLLYFLQWNVLEHGFSIYSILNLLFWAASLICLLYVCRESGIYKRKWAMLLLCLGLAAIIPFAGLWHLVSEDVGYRPMMLQSLTLVYIFIGILFEKWAGPVCKDVLALLLAAIILNNAMLANISYFYMNQCYERSYGESLEMAMAIHEIQEDHPFENVAILGTRIYEVQYETADPETGRMLVPGQLHLLSSCLEQTLLFDSEHTIRFLNATYGMDLRPIPKAERNALLDTEAVRAMGCWPAKSSVTVIGDTLVIKLSDRAE